MATFIESPRFPENVSYGMTGGPGFSTDIVVVKSGYENRNVNWSQARGKWDASHGVRTQSQMAALITFFRGVRGRAYGFRFKDWTDYAATVSEGILGLTGVATSETAYQMYKKYVSGSISEKRAIQKPVAATIKVFDNGVEMGSGWTLADTTGIVTFNPAVTVGHTITWSGEFDVPCRFDTDEMRINAVTASASSWGQIPIVEIMV